MDRSICFPPPLFSFLLLLLCTDLNFSFRIKRRKHDRGVFPFLVAVTEFFLTTVIIEKYGR